MAQVTVTLNGRVYRLECDDGEEQHLLTLAGEMGQHVEVLKDRFGQVGDDRLLLMAGLMLADQLAEARNQLEETNTLLAGIRDDKSATDELIAAAQAKIAQQISAAADRIEALSEKLSLPNGKDDAG
jgi:cell division protein ZapA